MNHEALDCGVHSLTYDFDKRIGTLLMPAGHCCDMTGCITLFAGIDPRVRRIVTFSGDRPDTVYQRENGTWRAYTPCHHEPPS